MATQSRQSPAAAAAQFHAICERRGVSSGSPQVPAAWEAFKEFCEIPLERTLEGAQFHLKQPKFQMPLGPFYLEFTRYWYEHGEESDTPHLAQFAFTYAFEPELMPLSCEMETNSNASDLAVDQATLKTFIEEIEGKTGLWNALHARRPISLDFYAGPQ